MNFFPLLFCTSVVMLMHVRCQRSNDAFFVLYKQELKMNGSDSLQHFTFEIQNLQPSTRYTTRGRCITQDNDWGQWTPSRAFHTGRSHEALLHCSPFSSIYWIPTKMNILSSFTHHHVDLVPFFSTGPLVTVDVWRQIRNGPDRTVTLLWHTVRFCS